MRANFLARAHRRREAHAIQAVINGLPHFARQLNRLVQKLRHQGKRKKSMRDGCSVGRFALRARSIYMNPLRVTGGIRELLYALLRNLHPAGYSDSLAHVRIQLLKRFQDERGHGLRFMCRGLPLRCLVLANAKLARKPAPLNCSAISGQLLLAGF